MKKIAFLSVIVLLSLSLSSCFTLMVGMIKNNTIKKTRFVEWRFDPSVPDDKSAKIVFWFDIKTYNAIDISRAFTIEKSLYPTPLVIIPAGVAEFFFDSGFTRATSNSTIYYTVKDCHFQYNFEAGKEYFITVGSELKSKGGLFKFDEYTYYARIYDLFPNITNTDRITKKDYKALEKSIKDKSHLIVSIPIFETDNLK